MSIPEFKLDAFEGPLDLLLHLISKHKLNIYDIEISLLLEQYLEYIEGLEEQDFDSAGDFLAMAARLVYIKTCSLLPQPEEAEEMKKELQGELLDYSACKAAAQRLSRQSVYGEVFVRPPEKLPVNKVFTGTIDPEKLIDAYLGMSAKARSMRPVRAEQFTPLVKSRFVTVTSKIIHVLKRLLRSGECTVAELYDGITDKSSRVATFLAVLELAKSGRIRLNDDNSLISFNRNAPRKHPQESDAVSDDTASNEVYADEAADDHYDSVDETAAEEQYSDDTADFSASEDESAAFGEISDEADEQSDEPAHEDISDNTGGPLKERTSDAKSGTFRIALETMSARHSIAIPAFALFAEAPTAPDDAEEQSAGQQGDTAETAPETVLVQSTETEDSVTAEEAVQTSAEEYIPAEISVEIKEDIAAMETVPSENTPNEPAATPLAEYIPAVISAELHRQTADVHTEDIPSADEKYTDIPAVSAEDVPETTGYTGTLYTNRIKWINRFAVRRYWGYPYDCRTGWSCRRERL